MTLSLAESCTGGLAGCLITALPGASSYFLGGVVSYSDGAKERILGVSRGTLEAHGAVSAGTAAEMALGARELFSSDYAASVTGIAGPGGATEGKPVGLVHIAATDGVTVLQRADVHPGGRDEVRRASAEAMLSLLAELIGR